jgi:hypothetical protein
LGAVLQDSPENYPETATIPGELRRFVMRCLEKDPTDRYQSARDLLIDLRAYQAEEIKQSAARIRFRSVPPWRQRRSRIIIRVAIGVLLFAVGLYAGSCWERGRHTGVKATTSAASPGRGAISDLT